MGYNFKKMILPDLDGNADSGAESVLPSVFGATSVLRNCTDCKSFMLIAIDARGLEFLSSEPLFSCVLLLVSPFGRLGFC